MSKFAYLHICLFALCAVMLGGRVAYADEPGRIAFARQQNGNWDIYTMAADGRDEQRLTVDPAPDRAPAWSPEGTRIAFESRRDNNWDVYLLDLASGETMRLTDAPGHDGAPAWSPDGKRIAFESDRDGDLDIFVMNADGTKQTNLTMDEPTGETDPTWSPDGRWIAFTSWRENAAMNDNEDVYVMRPNGSDITNLTNYSGIDEHPAWSPDGKWLAYSSQRGDNREIFVVQFDAARGRRGVASYALTWTGYDDMPAWSSDGESIAFVSRYYDGWQISVAALGDFRSLGDFGSLELPHHLTDRATLNAYPDWHGAGITTAHSFPTAQNKPLYAEKSSPSPGGFYGDYDFARLEGVDAGIALLSDRVDDSFMALRARALMETGYDFLAELSEALRPIDFYTDDSNYASWHKAGRAFDTPWDFNDRYGVPRMELVQEVIRGETFWRIYIKCKEQDGTCGEPLRDLPWDFTGWYGSWEWGEPKLPYPYYYVDFTDLARQYSWMPISSYDDPGFSWKHNWFALEYWHFQKTEGLVWYDAMLQVYPSDEVADFFSWDDVVKPNNLSDSADAYLAALKGVPLPPEERRWLRLRK